MKKHIPECIIAIALVLAIATMVRFGKVVENYNVMREAFEAAVKEMDESHKEMMANVAKANALIAQQGEAILASSKKIEDLNEAIKKKNEGLAVLEGELATATTDAQRVPILMNMVEGWKSKYADLESVVSEKDKQLEAWEFKYNEQVRISDSWKQEYESEHKLRLMSMDLTSALQKKYNAHVLGSNVVKAGLVALAAYAGYRAIFK